MHVRTRDARVGDKLVTRNFGTGTRGFADPADPDCAVCVKPGTELAFDSNIELFHTDADSGHKTAIFRQVNKEHIHMHHDSLEFPNGVTSLLTYVTEGQTATVLQLPAAPTNDAEASEQRRVEVVA